MHLRGRALCGQRDAAIGLCLSLHRVPALVRQHIQHVDAGHASFSLTRGAPRSYRRTGAGGVERTYWFCGDCGGRPYGQRHVRPDVVIVRAGTLDDTSWLRPVAHVYLRCAQAWEKIPNNAECFDIRPADFAHLAGQWQQMWEDTND
jgi:hypothetical protein